MIKVLVVTGSRAEYGLFLPLLKRLQTVQEYKLQIIATGMHLSPEFGLTYRQIEDDGFEIADKVEMLLSSDTEVGIAKSIGLGVVGFADSLRRLRPDLMMVLGDRFESFAAVIAASIAKIPVVHIHGGELTEGLIDEAIRHSITKMSLFHFVATEEYRKRVIQLGEAPERVFNVGALAIDNIKELKLLTRQELEAALGIEITTSTVLTTFHPVTLENNSAAEQFQELLAVFDSFPDLKVIFTKPNADTNGRVIIELMDEYVSGNPGKAKAFTSLGQLKYLSAIKYAGAVVGNSSSGLIEVPSFGRPTVNIGDRQRGRVQAESVLNCLPQKDSIILALEKALSPDFQALCRKVQNPYGNGNTAEKIVQILMQQKNRLLDIKKSFYDIEVKL